jgi:hypothetical protein
MYDRRYYKATDIPDEPIDFGAGLALFMARPDSITAYKKICESLLQLVIKGNSTSIDNFINSAMEH